MKDLQNDRVLQLSYGTGITSVSEEKMLLYNTITGKVMEVSKEIIKTLKKFEDGISIGDFLKRHDQNTKLLNKLVYYRFLIEKDACSSFEIIENIYQTGESNVLIDLSGINAMNQLQEGIDQYCDLVKEHNLRRINFQIIHCSYEINVLEIIDYLNQCYKEYATIEYYVKLDRNVDGDLALELKKRNVGVGLYYNTLLEETINQLKKYNNKFVLLLSIHEIFDLKVQEICNKYELNVFISGEVVEQISMDMIRNIENENNKNQFFIIGFWEIITSNFTNRLLSNDNQLQSKARLIIDNKGMHIRACDDKIQMSKYIGYPLYIQEQCKRCRLKGCCGIYAFNYDIVFNYCDILREYFDEWIVRIYEKCIGRVKNYGKLD